MTWKLEVDAKLPTSIIPPVKVSPFAKVTKLLSKLIVTTPVVLSHVILLIFLYSFTTLLVPPAASVLIKCGSTF